MKTNNIEAPTETVNNIVSTASQFFYIPWEMIQFIIFIIILSIITSVFTKRNIAKTYSSKIKQQKAKRLYNRRLNKKTSWSLLFYIINTILFIIGALAMSNEYSRPLGIGLIMPAYISYAPIKIIAEYKIIGSLVLVLIMIGLSTFSYNDKKACYQINTLSRQILSMTFIAIIIGYVARYFINIEPIVFSMTIGVAIFSVIANEIIVFVLTKRYDERKDKTPNGLEKRYMSQIKY